MRSWLSVLITDAESKKVFDIPIAPSLYSLSNKMDNSLLAVRDINHKYIVVESMKKITVLLIAEKVQVSPATHFYEKTKFQMAAGLRLCRKL